jgi:hypothetical protein
MFILQSTGELPGNAFGFNGYGLTFSVNALYPKAVLPKRIRKMPFSLDNQPIT